MVEIIDETGRFRELAPQWNELLQDSAADCPFLTAEWLGAWWTHLSGGARLRLIVVHEGSRPIAIAPLMVAGGSLGMFPRLEFLGTGHAGSDYLDVIVRRGYERQGLETIGQAIKAENRTLRLNHLTTSSLATRLAADLVGDGWTSKKAQVAACPFIPLAGHTWDSYLASLGASHRANFRRRLRALTQKFEVRFELAASDDDRREAVSALIRFHEQRFGDGGSTAFLTPALRAFHGEATARALEGGWLRLYVLRLDGVPAAVMYGFAYNRRFYFYQHGFDAQYEQFSAGLVLMGMTIQAAFEQGAVEFDMLYGTERYKSLWARDERPLVQLQLFPPDVVGALHRRTVEAERTMRAVARRILTIGAARAT